MTHAPTLRLIGAPTDIGASRLGSAMGPDALRVAGLGPALRRLGCPVRDIGNLAGPPNPQTPPEQGLRHLAPARAWMDAVHQAVGQALADGELPLMLADTGRLGSLDLVELNPALDLRNQTAELVVDLLESLFGKSTLVRADR